MAHSTIPKSTRLRAKALRRDMTRAEKALWSLLQDFNALGASFRRETPIGPYIADFAWLSQRLVIEADGDSHGTDEGRRHDAVRDTFLHERGFEVLRFDNAQITDGLDHVWTVMDACLSRRGIVLQRKERRVRRGVIAE
jgi:very-short-patch-repair endonuclease